MLEMTRAEYARHRGVSRQAVSKMVSAGRIPLTPSGKINPAEADFALGQTQQRAVAREPEPPAAAPIESALNKARAQQAAIEAELKRLQLERELGRLVPTEQIATAASVCAAMLTQALSRMTARTDDMVTAAMSEGHTGVRNVFRQIEREVRAAASDAFARLASAAAQSSKTPVEADELDL